MNASHRSTLKPYRQASPFRLISITMTAVIRSLFLLLLVLAGLHLAPSANAQVVVYRLEFKHQDGFNVDYYTGGYLAAPLLGGTGNFILTAIENGRRVLDASPGSGTYFLARSGDKRYNVVSATIGNGADSSANGSYVASGEAKRTINIVTPTGTYKIKLATVLKGESLAADDENGEVKFNGTVGTADFSDLTLYFEEGLTQEYNNDGFSLEETATRLTRLLRWRGFANPDATDDDDDDDDDNGTGNGNGNGTGVNIGTGTGTGTGNGSNTTTSANP